MHAGAGIVVADGRSEARETARVSDRKAALEARATGEGGGEEAGGWDACEGRNNDGGG